MPRRILLSLPTCLERLCTACRVFGEPVAINGGGVPFFFFFFLLFPGAERTSAHAELEHSWSTAPCIRLSAANFIISVSRAMPCPHFLLVNRVASQICVAVKYLCTALPVYSAAPQEEISAPPPLGTRTLRPAPLRLTRLHSDTFYTLSSR